MLGDGDCSKGVDPTRLTTRRFPWRACGKVTVRLRRFATSVSRWARAKSSDCSGANGARKTTTLECILGLRQPDGGSIRIVLDLRTHAGQAKRTARRSTPGSHLQDKITPRQALDLFGSFYSESFGTDELLARFDLEAKADVPFATLSGGLRQRLFLALALINRPTVLVLDEPTAGLDPQARRTLRTLICDMRSEGRTVLLSTHDLQEAGRLCDRIGIMDRGRILAVASPAELIARSESLARLTVRTETVSGEHRRGCPARRNAGRLRRTRLILETRPRRIVYWPNWCGA